MSFSNPQSKGIIFVLSIILLFLGACDFGPSTTPEEHIEKAKSFFAEDKPNEGIIELKNALQIDSNLPEARWLLGKIYLQSGNGAAAYKEISQAQSLGFTDPELNKLLLQAMLLQGKNQEILDQTFTEEAMSVETLVLRGNAQLGLRKFDEARASFNEALAEDNFSASAIKGLISVALSVSDLEEADKLIEEALSFALEDPQVWILKGQLAFLQNAAVKAEEAFAKAIRLDGTNVMAQFGLARALLMQNKVEEAVAPVDAVESLYPKLPLIKYYRGYFALMANDTDKAKALLQEVVAVMPKHPESLLLLSRIHYDEGQLAQAETYINTFLASYPGHLPAIKLLSVIQLRQKQPGASVETLSAASSHAQGDWQVLALLGSALMESGEIEKGIEMLEQASQINPDTAAVHTQLAIGHLVAGSLASAVTELESAIELDPELIRADILLILAHIKSGNFAAAISSATVLAEKHPDNPLSFNLLGAAYLSNNDADKARAQFEKALSLKADFTPAISNLARLDLLADNPDAAEKKYKEILQIDENNSDALEGLARIEDSRGNSDKMRALLERARTANPAALRPRLLLSRAYLQSQKPGKLLEVITEAHDLSPQNPEVLLFLGQAYRLNGDAEKSLNTLEPLLSVAPDSSEVLFQIGLALAQAGKIEEAKTNFNTILKKEGENPASLIALSRIAMSEKDYDSANKYLARIKKSDKNLTEAHILEGDIQVEQKKYAAAIASYEKALARLQSSNIVIKLANTYKLSGDEKQMTATLNKWIKEHPEDASASLYLASHQQSSGEDKPAIDNYEKILESSPDNVIALNNLAWLYLESNPSKAVDLARKANQLAPDSPEIMDTLGWILVQQKNVEEGLSFLGPAREAGAKIPSIRYHFATALHAAGDKGRAKSEVISLLDEFPTFDERGDAEALLKKLE